LFVSHGMEMMSGLGDRSCVLGSLVGATPQPRSPGAIGYGFSAKPCRYRTRGPSRVLASRSQAGIMESFMNAMVFDIVDDLLIA